MRPDGSVYLSSSVTCASCMRNPDGEAGSLGGISGGDNVALPHVLPSPFGRGLGEGVFQPRRSPQIRMRQLRQALTLPLRGSLPLPRGEGKNLHHGAVEIDLAGGLDLDDPEVGVAAGLA